MKDNAEAIAIANELIEKRQLEINLLKEYATEYYYELFEAELKKVIIPSLHDLIIPKSRYLSEKELKKIFSKVLYNIREIKKGMNENNYG